MTTFRPAVLQRKIVVGFNVSARRGVVVHEYLTRANQRGLLREAESFRDQRAARRRIRRIRRLGDAAENAVVLRAQQVVAWTVTRVL